MASFLEDLAIEALQLFAGHDEANEFLINRLVNRGRNRPHPWTTKNDYISWTGLTDRNYNARLLRAKPYPAVEALGTRKPPLAELVKLFQAAPTGQRVCRKSTMLFPAFAQYLTDGFLRTQMANKPPFDVKPRYRPKPALRAHAGADAGAARHERCGWKERAVEIAVDR
jgi:prostaglandin-endoperoxide synthase 2